MVLSFKVYRFPAGVTPKGRQAKGIKMADFRDFNDAREWCPRHGEPGEHRLPHQRVRRMGVDEP